MKGQSICVMGYFVCYRKSKKKYTVHEVICMLEEESDLTSADVYILPPDNSTGSDEDSGDEDSGCIDNLTRRQLEAEAADTYWMW